MDGEQDDRKYTRLAGVWTHKDGTEWLVDFYLTDLDGKLECVGMNVRSFVLPEERDIAFRWGAIPPASAAEEAAAPAVYALHKRGGEVTPRPLRSAVLRADLLGKVLPDLIAKAQETLIKLANTHEKLGNREATKVIRGLPVAQAETQRGGRPRKYTDEDLVHAAEVFTKARDTGSPAPYKVVARELKLKSKRPGGESAMAGKLIFECRKRGLLPPAPKRPRKTGEKP